MKLKCIIVDDEPLAIRIIKKHISKIHDLDIVAECENAVQAFEFLQKQKVDLIFLDIQMPELTGIDFLKTIQNPPKVIVTTAYREYAIEGFELDVVDYLLKPVSFERFLKAIKKVYDKSEPDIVLKNKILEAGSFQDEFLLVKVKKKLVRVYLKDILYIENLRDYILIKTTEKEVVTKMLLRDMEEKLPEEQFLRIHRSFIVAIGKIDSFSPSSVEINDFEIPIGRSFKALVLKKLNYYTVSNS